MAEPPSGTLTFLFTDIEGSSGLWEKSPEPMRRSLTTHDRLLRTTFERHGGFVFKTVGDAFCVAFDNASAALAAALTAQRALRSETWSETGPLRVRMALHTGAAEHRNSDYFGQPLNRVARLLSTAHGGQTVLSLATEELVRDQLDEGVGLRDLGEHRLRDLQRPERVFQLVATDLRETFPPLRSLEILPNNLPIQLTTFIGREREITEVKKLLAETHLLTLTGAGGTGKTRLSTQAAAEVLDNFKDGVWFVELATLSDPALVVEMVATAVGVREQPDRPLLDTLTTYLRPKTLLILLDNCEHLTAACAQLAQTLLRTCPQLRILATSREALGIPGETTWMVPPLAMPDPRGQTIDGIESAATISQYEAVKLFIDRAISARPGFTVSNENAPWIAQICWRLDGIPLAIELAAARTKVLAPEQIAQRLDDRFRLLTGGSRTAMPRQQTLRALIDWSYDLLSEKERMLLRRLSAFARGRTIDAIEEVCAGDGIDRRDVLDLLTQLVDKSLVTVETGMGSEARYYVSESVWDYGFDRLTESGEAPQVRDRHLNYFVRFAEDAEDELVGPDQLEWLGRVEMEDANLRTALDWSLEKQAGAQDGLRIAGSLGRYWEIRSHLQEARDRLVSLLARPDAAAPTAGRAKALMAAGRLAWCQSDLNGARAYEEEALAIFQELGDIPRVVFLLGNLGMVAADRGDIDQARILFERCLAVSRESGDKRGLGLGLNGLGILAARNADYSSARALKEQSLDLFRAVGDRWISGILLWSLGVVATAQGDYRAAQALLKESCATAMPLGNKWGTPYALEAFAALAVALGHGERAARLLGAAQALRGTLGVACTPNEEESIQRSIAAARQMIGEAPFTAAMNEGRSMSSEQALTYASTD